MPLQYRVAGKTDIGLVRQGNEDYLHLDDKNMVFAVCDGMGGHQAGEVASMTASQTLHTLFNHLRDEVIEEERLDIGHSLPASGEVLLKSIRLANRCINRKAESDPALSGMGTTIVAVALDSDMMSVAHVGDSRAYRLEQRKLQPLTSDHSWVSEIQASQSITREEAESVVGKNVITRALGVRDTVEVDYRLLRLRPGDIFILCSDGLCGFADDDEIFEVANKHRSDITKMVDQLVQLANDRGGSDNVTVVALQIDDVTTTDLSEVDVFTLPAEDEERLRVEDEWTERISRAEEESEIVDEDPPDSDGGSTLRLAIIFIVFAVVAAIIVYVAATGK